MAARAEIRRQTTLRAGSECATNLSLLFAHALLEIGIAITVDIARPRSANGVIFPEKTPTKRNTVDYPAIALIPACTDHARHQVVLVAVTHLVQNVGRYWNLRRLARLQTVHVEVHAHNIGDGLGIRSRTRTAHVHLQRTSGFLSCQMDSAARCLHLIVVEEIKITF